MCGSCDESSPLLYEFAKVIRPLAIEVHLLLGSRMHKAKCLGMECLSWAEFETILYKSLVTATSLSSQYFCTTIRLVHKERMTDMLHVSTNLMGSTCLQHTLHKRGISKALQYPIMRYRTFTDTTIRVEHLHTKTILGISSDVPLDTTFVLNDISPYQSIVSAMGGLIEKLLSQRGLGTRSLCHNKQTRRILINTMHQSHFRIVGIKFRHISQMPGYSLNQRTMEITSARMHYHTSLFIYDQQLVIFINHIDVNLLWFDAGLMSWTVHHQRDHIIRANLIITLYRFPVDMDKTGISSLLNTITALVCHFISQVFINSHRILISIHLHLPVLIEFTMASIARFTRSEMIEVLDSDYMLLAESKGISGPALIFRHALRNALIPIITVLAPLIVDLMTGSLVVEKIFAIPGVGSLLVTAIQSNDYNVVIGLSFIYSAMYIGIMLVVDLLYGIIDPRIRLAKGDD